MKVREAMLQMMGKMFIIALLLLAPALAEIALIDLGSYNLSFETNASEGYSINVNRPEIFESADGTPYLKYPIELTRHKSDEYGNQYNSIGINIYRLMNPIFAAPNLLINEALDAEKTWMEEHQQKVELNEVKIDEHDGYLLKAEYNPTEIEMASTPSQINYAIYKLTNNSMVEIESFAPWKEWMSNILESIHVEQKA